MNSQQMTRDSLAANAICVAIGRSSSDFGCTPGRVATKCIVSGSPGAFRRSFKFDAQTGVGPLLYSESGTFKWSLLFAVETAKLLGIPTRCSFPRRELSHQKDPTVNSSASNAMSVDAVLEVDQPELCGGTPAGYAKSQRASRERDRSNRAHPSPCRLACGTQRPCHSVPERRLWSDRRSGRAGGSPP